MDRLKRLPRSVKQNLCCRMVSRISAHSVRSRANGLCRFSWKSFYVSKESSCGRHQTSKTPKHQFLTPEYLKGLMISRLRRLVALPTPLPSHVENFPRVAAQTNIR